VYALVPQIGAGLGLQHCSGASGPGSGFGRVRWPDGSRLLRPSPLGICSAAGFAAVCYHGTDKVSRASATSRPLLYLSPAFFHLGASAPTPPFEISKAHSLAWKCRCVGDEYFCGTNGVCVNVWFCMFLYVCLSLLNAVRWLHSCQRRLRVCCSALRWDCRSPRSGFPFTLPSVFCKSFSLSSPLLCCVPGVSAFDEISQLTRLALEHQCLPVETKMATSDVRLRLYGFLRVCVCVRACPRVLCVRVRVFGSVCACVCCEFTCLYRVLYPLPFFILSAIDHSIHCSNATSAV
jgi:hypothetical protein